MAEAHGNSFRMNHTLKPMPKPDWSEAIERNEAY